VLAHHTHWNVSPIRQKTEFADVVAVLVSFLTGGVGRDVDFLVAPLKL
jgi:hypothetical protein